jgi:hypothetical protein
VHSATAAPKPVSSTAVRVEDPERLAALAALAALLAVGVAQASDLLTFLRMVSIAGIGAELNPLVSEGADTLGFVPLVLAKAALVVLVGAVFTIVARSHRRTAATVATLGTLAGLLGAFSNVFAII